MVRAGLLFTLTFLPLLAAADESLLAHSDSLWEAGARAAALAEIDSLLAVIEASDEPHLRTELLTRRGARRIFLGDVVGAEGDLRLAGELSTAHGDSAILCSTIRWLSLAVGIQGRRAEAHSLYGDLLALARKIGDRTHEGWAHIGYASDASYDGHVDQAVAHYEQASALFRASGEVEGELWAENGLGIAYSAQGAYQRAIVCFKRTVAAAKEVNNTLIRAMALNNLGSLEYMTGDPGTAVGHFETALAIHHQLGSLRETITPATNIAHCQVALHQFHAAEEIFAEYLRTCQDHRYPDLAGIVYFERGELEVRSGHPHRAIRSYRAALAYGDTLHIKQRLQAWLGLHRALVAVDSTAAALDVLAEGLQCSRGRQQHDLEIELESELGYRLLGLGRTAQALPHAERAFDLAREMGDPMLQARVLVLLARTEEMNARPDNARAYLEQAATHWEAGRALPLDPRWRERRGAVGQEIFTSLGLAYRDPARAFDRLQAYKARTLLERMLGPGKRLAEHLDAAAKLTTLADLQEETLRSGELFLDIYLGARASLLFALTRDSCRLITLPPKDALRGPLKHYRELLSQQDSPLTAKMLVAANRTLRAKLFGEIEDLLAGNARIVIAPDGISNLIPWSALLSAPEDHGLRPCLRVPSATLLRQMRRRETSRGPMGILALAGEYSESGEELRGAIREVQELANTYRDVRTYLLPRDTLTYHAAELEQSQVIHIASHVRVDDDSPWQSAFHLPGAQLKAAEIAGLDLTAQLAVLSSCESVGGAVLSGEGVLGLSSAFLSAGTRAIVASLWPVHDRATADLMRHFYDQLARGEPVAAALRSAQEKIRRNPETAHPFYWAGFVPIGAGDVSVMLQKRRSPAPRLLAGIALLLISGAFLLCRR